MGWKPDFFGGEHAIEYTVQIKLLTNVTAIKKKELVSLANEAKAMGSGFK